jgi:AcrR family transcriptional regulator
MPKWRRRPDERPTQITYAALEVFAEKGFARATMDEIANAAGITKGTIYLYFNSKKELFLAVLREQMERFLALLPALDAIASGDLEEQARALGRVFMAALLDPETTKTVQLILAELQHLPEVKQLYQEEAVPRANVRVAGFLQAQMDRGIFRSLDPMIATRCLFGMFFIFVLTQEIFGASRVTPMSPETIVDTVIDIFFHGIVKRGAV